MPNCFTLMVSGPGVAFFKETSTCNSSGLATLYDVFSFLPCSSATMTLSTHTAESERRCKVSSRPTISAVSSDGTSVHFAACEVCKAKVGPSKDSNPHCPRKVPLTSGPSLAKSDGWGFAAPPEERTKPPRAGLAFTGRSIDAPDLLHTCKIKSCARLVEKTRGAPSTGRTSEEFCTQ